MTRYFASSSSDDSTAMKYRNVARLFRDVPVLVCLLA